MDIKKVSTKSISQPAQAAKLQKPAPSNNQTSTQPPSQKNNGTKTVIIVVVAVLVFFIIAATLSYFFLPKLINKGTETAIEKATGVDINKNDDGTYSVRGDDGTFSTENKVPADFPKDVPIYPNSTVKSSINYQGGYNLVLENSEEVTKIDNYYESELTKNGWQREGEKVALNNLTTLTFKKDSRRVSVTIASEGGKTVINLGVANT